MGYINNHIDMVGINNRNLGTFHTDVDNSFRMVDLLPKELVKVSESGIYSSKTIKDLRGVGYQGFLIGELFMRMETPSDELAILIDKLQY